MFTNHSTESGTLHSAFDNSREVSFRYFGICSAVFITVVGGIGNLLTILSFVLNRKLRTTFNVFIVNLSLVDFITSVIAQPLVLASYIEMQWPFGNSSITTRLQAFGYFSCGYTSVVFLVAITVNRFIGVVRPNQYKTFFGRRRLIITLVFCWTFAPVCLLPFLVGTDPKCVRPQTPDGPLTGFNSRQFLCTFVCLPKNGWNTYMQLVRVVFQFLTFAIIFGLYGYILVTMKRRSRKVAKHAMQSLTIQSFGAAFCAAPTNTMVNSNSLDRPQNGAGQRKRSVAVRIKKGSPRNIFLRKSSFSSGTSTRRRKSEKRLLFMSLAICIGFMISFFPSMIINLLPGKNDFDPRIHMMASNLSWYNTALNPIIYAIMNQRFRKEYLRIIMAAFEKVKCCCTDNSASSSFRKHSAMSRGRRQVENV